MNTSFKVPVMWTEKVKTAWCDYNDHLNMAYYVLIFDHATDIFHESIGLDKTYRQTADCSTFAVETHTNYLSEVRDGDQVSVTTQLLDQNEKCLHYFHRMFHSEKHYLAATTEIMTVHVDLSARKVVPMPDRIQEAATNLWLQHSVLDAPKQQGHKIGIRKS